MNPHLVTAAADEAYVPPEARVADVELCMATVPSAQQVSDLLAGHRHGVRRTQISYWDRRLRTRLARRQARQRYWAAAVERSGLAVERARSNLADTPAVRRPYSRFGAILATGLLMLASFFTISSILASADLPPLEAWLLPLAFGPVFGPIRSLAISDSTADEFDHRAMSGYRLAVAGHRCCNEERCCRRAGAADRWSQPVVIGADLRGTGVR
jgi:hypothetical protein